MPGPVDGAVRGQHLGATAVLALTGKAIPITRARGPAEFGKPYAGFITVEQERDPRNAGGSLADVKASRDYLKSVGFSATSKETAA